MNGSLVPTPPPEVLNNEPAAPTPVPPVVPKWVLIVGAVCLGLVLIFFMLLIGLSIAGKSIPCGDRFLVAALLALVTAIGVGFLGGGAALKGQVPWFDKHPVAFSATGGVAVFVLVLLIVNATYVSGCEGEAPQLSLAAVEASLSPQGVPRIAIRFSARGVPGNAKGLLEVSPDQAFEPTRTIVKEINDLDQGTAVFGLSQFEGSEGYLRLKLVAGSVVISQTEGREFQLGDNNEVN